MLVFPVLFSSRLKLRQLTADDIPDLIFHVNNPNVSKQIVNIPYPYSEFNAVHRLSYVASGFKDRTRFVFAITLKEEDKVVGEISLHMIEKGRAELGYWLGETLWSTGIMTEAIACVTHFGFDRLRLGSIVATVHEENPASRVVLDKNDFKINCTTTSVITFIKKSEN
jgi:[ribosomal protein S5]-alanine N-acetyltransferase